MNHYSHPVPETLDHPAGATPAVGRFTGNDLEPHSAATIIVNADDWGRDANTTDRSLDCLLRGAISSVSAMVFMEDSERAAVLARQHGVDAGLHLNLTTSFSAPQCPPRLAERQRMLSHFLRSNRLAQVVYHPGLAVSFEYVVRAQLEEYERLSGSPANRVDGHHHMHLCANVFFQKLLPAGAIVRRNFSFGPGEKGAVNRLYRRWQDRGLAQRHRMTDFFFSLPPLEPRIRLEKIVDLAKRCNVELETHPVNPEEYRFLIDGELFRHAGKLKVAPGYILRSGEGAPNDGAPGDSALSDGETA
jgi:chitin disaccharide deacetylase